MRKSSIRRQQCGSAEGTITMWLDFGEGQLIRSPVYRSLNAAACMMVCTNGPGRTTPWRDLRLPHENRE